jgi:hypothetical protein
MARLWDTNMADKAAAIDQAIKLGGVVVHPPKNTGFGQERRPEPPHRLRLEAEGSHLPGSPDEPY